MKAEEVTFDHALNLDQQELMAEMDKVQPEWAIWYAKQVDLIDFARGAGGKGQGIVARDEAFKCLRNRTFNHIKDIVWLVGHSAICVEATKGNFDG